MKTNQKTLMKGVAFAGLLFNITGFQSAFDQSKVGDMAKQVGSSIGSSHGGYDASIYPSGDTKSSCNLKMAGPPFCL